VTIFATVGQITDGDIETRIIAGAGIGWLCMARQTTRQVVFGVRSVLQWVCVRYWMQSPWAGTVATGGAPIGICETGRIAAWGVVSRLVSIDGHLVTQGARRIHDIPGDNTMRRCVTRRDIIGSLPPRGVSLGFAVAACG
jgi:hypothetical protein